MYLRFLKTLNYVQIVILTYKLGQFMAPKLALGQINYFDERVLKNQNFCVIIL